MLIKRFLLFFLLLASVQVYNVKSENAFCFEESFFVSTEGDDDFFLHTIERGQTVFSIASMYKIPVETIYKLNPESKTGIKAGETLKIPQTSGSFHYHTIQPKETLYSVSKLYQMTGEDIVSVNPGLSTQTFTAGKTIRIPVNKVTAPIKEDDDNTRQRTNALLSKSTGKEAVDHLKIFLLMPFGIEEGTSVENASINRFVEYYEGFLMALNKVKKEGISVDLKVYDIGVSGTQKLQEIFKNEPLADVDLIVGGYTDTQIRFISGFSKSNNIPFVIPFTSKSDEPLYNPNVFQINTPQSYLYSKASAAFCKKYKSQNVIFAVSDPEGEKMEFVRAVQSHLNQQGTQFSTLMLNENFLQGFKADLKSDRINVVVPSDDSSETLTKLTAYLKLMTSTHPEYRFALFGYPGWQVYGEHLESYFKYNTSIYSVFYADPSSPEIKAFQSDFHKWFSRDLINTFPKFGILGYDSGLFFIQAIHEYGSGFKANLNKLKFEGVQMNFRFDRVNNWGGFINTNLFIVNFNSDHTITKTNSQ